MYIMNKDKDKLFNTNICGTIEITKRRVNCRDVYRLMAGCDLSGYEALAEYSNTDDAKAALREIADAITDGVTLLEML